MAIALRNSDLLHPSKEMDTQVANQEFNRDDITSITESVEANAPTSVEDPWYYIYIIIIINERTRAISEEGTYYYRELFG